MTKLLKFQPENITAILSQFILADIVKQANLRTFF